MTDIARIRLTMSTPIPVPHGVAMPLIWDGCDDALLWAPPVLPVSDPVLPYTGMLSVEVADCDFGDKAVSQVGDRLLAVRFDLDAYTTRALQRVPAAQPTALSGTRRRIPVTAGQQVGIYVRQWSGVTLQIAAVHCLLTYEEIES